MLSRETLRPALEIIAPIKSADRRRRNSQCVPEFQDARTRIRGLPQSIDTGPAAGAAQIIALIKLRIRPDEIRIVSPNQPSQLSHSSFRASSAASVFQRPFHSTTSQPRRSASARKAGFGLTTTRYPTSSNNGVSATESEYR
jgi:hypothetical protein